MQTRLSKTKWTAFCVGMLLMSSPLAPTRADGQDFVDDCPPQGRISRWWHGRQSSRCMRPVDGAYCDYRDRQVYSAEGYNVPVTVPLAPVVRVYNYGWGVPSTRLSRVGNYAAWNPQRPYSQNGGSLPGGMYPVVYHATDTTQLGYYYNYVPTWQPRLW